MSEKNSSMSFGFGLLAGVIGGIVAGILYAPKPGEESRKQVSEAISDIAEKHSPEVKEARQQALESIDLVKYKLERQLRKLSHMLKSKKLQKAKELEELEEFEDSEYDFN